MEKAGKITVLVLMMYALIAAACTPKEAVRRASIPARVAVVLGAGAARGFAHIGVLKVLEANNIPVHMVVGTSAGSLVGSLYAYGFNAFQVQKMALALDKGDLIDLTVPDNGFIKGEKLEEYVNSMVRQTPIEKFRLPFFAVATSLPGGQEVVFGKGNTGRAVRASCSVPGIFRPVEIAGNDYVDGGVVSPVAVDAARRYGADFVIAVDISADLDTSAPQSTVDTILQSITIMYSRLSSTQLARADVIIRPKVGYIGPADFDKRHEAIMEGEKAALAALPAIRTRLEGLARDSRLPRPGQAR